MIRILCQAALAKTGMTTIVKVANGCQQTKGKNKMTLLHFQVEDMNRLPGEIVVDVFINLDRDNLEALQLSCRRFRRLINLKMELMCLRQIEKLRFSPGPDGLHVVTVQSGSLEKICQGHLDDIVRFLSNVVYAADVRSLEVADVVLTRELREKMATIVPFMTVRPREGITCASLTGVFRRGINVLRNIFAQCVVNYLFSVAKKLPT